jgi:hypothetical protein
MSSSMFLRHHGNLRPDYTALHPEGTVGVNYTLTAWEPIYCLTQYHLLCGGGGGGTTTTTTTSSSSSVEEIPVVAESVVQ